MQLTQPLSSLLEKPRETDATQTSETSQDRSGDGSDNADDADTDGDVNMAESETAKSVDADDTEEEPDAIAAEKAKAQLAKKGGRAPTTAGQRKSGRPKKKRKSGGE